MDVVFTDSSSDEQRVERQKHDPENSEVAESGAGAQPPVALPGQSRGGLLPHSTAAAAAAVQSTHTEFVGVRRRSELGRVESIQTVVDAPVGEFRLSDVVAVKLQRGWSRTVDSGDGVGEPAVEPVLNAKSCFDNLQFTIT